ncbi:hypothetical protein ACLOJK_033207 [Asimina triloba]
MAYHCGGDDHADGGGLPGQPTSALLLSQPLLPSQPLPASPHPPLLLPPPSFAAPSPPLQPSRFFSPSSSQLRRTLRPYSRRPASPRPLHPCSPAPLGRRLLHLPCSPPCSSLPSPLPAPCSLLPPSHLSSVSLPGVLAFPKRRTAISRLRPPFPLPSPAVSRLPSLSALAPHASASASISQLRLPCRPSGSDSSRSAQWLPRSASPSLLLAIEDSRSTDLAGNILEMIEQHLEEQSLDILSAEKMNLGEIKEEVSRAKKNEIQHLTSMLEKVEEQNSLLRARIESLKAKQNLSSTDSAAEKVGVKLAWKSGLEKRG